VHKIPRSNPRLYSKATMIAEILYTATLFLVARQYRAALKPTQPAASKTEQMPTGKGTLLFLRPLAVCTRMAVYIHLTMESIAFCLRNSDEFRQTMKSICHPHRCGSVYESSIPSTYVLVGAVLVIMGGSIRQQCYKALGDMFTWELSVKSDHKLVTSGPYAYVRHPGYTGKYMAEIGYFTLLLSQGTFFRGCLVHRHPYYALFDYSVQLLIHFSVSLWLAFRTRDEDEQMRKRFGAEWDKWAQRVNCRFIPYLI